MVTAVLKKIIASYFQVRYCLNYVVLPKRPSWLTMFQLQVFSAGSGLDTR